MRYRLEVNGRPRTVDVPADMPLLHVLRDHLALKATRYGCGLAECGACNVLIDGRPRQSCVLPVSAVDGPVTTVEGLGTAEAPGVVQQAFIDEQAAQCGYCISGMMIATEALLARNPQPDDAAIASALSGNLCGCGTHLRIVRAVKRAARLRAARDTA